MKRAAVITELECENCGAIIPISRKCSKQKKDGHYKHIWCYKCKEETRHVERKDKSSKAFR